jgi:hypothetical protein
MSALLFGIVLAAFGPLYGIVDMCRHFPMREKPQAVAGLCLILGWALIAIGWASAGGRA